MKKLTLAIALMSAMTISAQEEYRCYGDELFSTENECETIDDFDEVIDKPGKVKNVLVRETTEINYFHQNVVKENHYNISSTYRPTKKYVPRNNTYRSNNSTVNRRVYNSHADTYTRGRYDIYEDYDSDKWFFFFKFNSDYLMNREELAHLIDYAKYHPYAVFHIDAYADVETGDYYANLRVSKLRARAIANALMKEGIESRRMIVRCYGSTVQPYNSNNLNRCVTVTTK